MVKKGQQRICVAPLLCYFSIAPPIEGVKLEDITKMYLIYQMAYRCDALALLLRQVSRKDTFLTLSMSL